MGHLSLPRGNQLEKAVEFIEHAILNTTPSLREATFVLEPKKVLFVDGVKHEIDLYVGIDLGHGYRSVYIFECKNWKKAVGKNEIVVFSEKIRSAQAQKGYFIAQSFGKYAVAQAKLDRRIELLRASELPIEEFGLTSFHVVEQKIGHIDIRFGLKNINPTNIPVFDPYSLSAEYQGQPLDFLPFINGLGKSIMEKRISKEATETLSGGTYDYNAEAEYDFEEGTLMVNGTTVHKLKLVVKFSIAVHWPRVVSRFDIESRGRIIQFEKVTAEQRAGISISLIMPY